MARADGAVVNLDDYLASKGSCWEALVQAVAIRVDLQAEDVLVATGSLVDGLGNASSDVDFFLITDRNDIEFTSLRDITLDADGCDVDIRTIPLAEATDLVERFSRWAAEPRAPRSAFCFTRDERRFFHGLATGRVARRGEALARLRTPLVADRALARHKLDWSAHLIGVTFKDLVGFRAASDALSLLFAAQELLGLALDALLAGRGVTIPGRKWRTRLVELGGKAWEQTLPGRMSGSLIERLLDLHRAPDPPDLARVVRQGLEIAALARSFLAFAERAVLSGAPAVPLPRPFASKADSGIKLPALDFDVIMQFSGNEFILYRLGNGNSVRFLSEAEFVLLSQFDGATPLSYARRYAAMLDPLGNDILDDLLRTTHDLRAHAPVDEREIVSVLRYAGRAATSEGEVSA